MSSPAFANGFNWEQGRQQHAQAVADQSRLAQKNQLGSLYLDAINTPLPKVVNDPSDPAYESSKQAYQDALSKRQNLMQQYVGLNDPVQHASFAQHLHGLIFGNPAPSPAAPALNAPQQAPTPTTTDYQSSTPAAPNELGDQIPASAAGPIAAPVDTSQMHPFAPHPALNPIMQGISTLGNHLRAAANPVIAKPQRDLSLVAQNYTSPEELKRQDLQSGYEAKLDQVNARAAAQIAAAKNRATYNREVVFPGASIGIADALKYSRPPEEGGIGEEYLDSKGNPIDLASVLAVNPYAKLVPASVNGQNRYYKLADMREGTYDANNQVITKPEVGPIAGAPVLGQQRTGNQENTKIINGNGDLVEASQHTTVPLTPPLPNAPIAPPSGPILKTRPVTQQSNTMATPNPTGLVEAGNLPIWNRPVVNNADGTHSSEYSTSFQDSNGNEVLVPTVVNGKFLTPDGKKPPEGSPQEKAMFQAAWQHYLQTGENLGKFDNADDADAYSQILHNRGTQKPVSRFAPGNPQDLSTVNANIAAANAASAKLNKGKPVSRFAPQDPAILQTQGVLPNINAMVPQQAAAARKAQPAVTALLGLYGDPQAPNVKSMADFADLANDPHAQKTIGEAINLLDQRMGEISSPGIIATLGNAAGWANYRAQVEQQVQQQAGSAMTPREKEYFDTLIASMADIIGSRAATGQSPAQFSVRSIQNELPVIGSSSVTDKKSYITKMDTIARQIKIGLNAMPDNKKALAWLAQRQGSLSSGKPVSANAPVVPDSSGATPAENWVRVNGKLVRQ